jgi:hypothetical protein
MLIIADFIIDAELEGDHRWSATITEHPVEEGVDIVDHISPRPVEITISGLVSDTPLEPLASQRGPNPSRDAFEHLRDLHAAREPVTIETSLDVFEDMALESFDVPTSAEIGDAFEFSATFRRIEIRSNERTTIPVTVPQAAKKVRRGKRPAKLVGENAEGEIGLPAPSATVTLGDSTFSPDVPPAAYYNDEADGYHGIYQDQQGGPGRIGGAGRSF